MDGSWDVDAAEGLTLLLTHAQVPEPLQAALQQTGLSSISDFAYAYTLPEDLASFIAKQSQDLWEQLQVADPEHSPAVARLRRALDMCKSITRRALVPPGRLRLRLTRQRLEALKEPGPGMRVIWQPAQESQECALWRVKEEQQSDDSIFEPVVLKPCEQPMLPEQDMSQPALLLLKGKNVEKEDLRTRIHHGCVYKYFGRPPDNGKQPEKIISHPTHLGTGGTRTVYSCPWDKQLVMKFSPWDQSAEKSWLLKLGNMSVKIQGAGTRSKEVWSVTLATRALPVTVWDTTRAWELANTCVHKLAAARRWPISVILDARTRVNIRSMGFSSS